MVRTGHVSFNGEESPNLNHNLTCELSSVVGNNFLGDSDTRPHSPQRLCHSCRFYVLERYCFGIPGRVVNHTKHIPEPGVGNWFDGTHQINSYFVERVIRDRHLLQRYLSNAPLRCDLLASVARDAVSVDVP